MNERPLITEQPSTGLGYRVAQIFRRLRSSTARNSIAQPLDLTAGPISQPTEVEMAERRAKEYDDDRYATHMLLNAHRQRKGLPSDWSMYDAGKDRDIAPKQDKRPGSPQG